MDDENRTPPIEVATDEEFDEAMTAVLNENESVLKRLST